MDQRLSVLTKQELELHRLHDAMRFLACASDGSSGSSPAAVTDTFLARFPTAVSAVMLRTKAASDPGSTTDVPWAGNLLPPALLNPVLTALRKASVLERIPGVTPVPFNVPIPLLGAAPQIIQWIAEAAPKPVSELIVTQAIIAPTKVAGILVLTEELVRASGTGAAALMASVMVDAVTTFTDQQFLDPAVAAVVGLQPASITNGVTPTAAGTTLPDSVSAVLAALYAGRPQTRRPTLVMSPANWSALAKTSGMPAAGPEGGVYTGATVVTTPGAANHLVGLDAAAVFVSDTGGAIDTSREALVQMNTTPDNPATAATVLVSLWQQNLRGFRIDRGLGWTKAANAVQFATVT